jgi:hypothetical protein
MEDGILGRVFSTGDQLPDGQALYLRSLGQPLLGEDGTLGLVADASGEDGQEPARKVKVILRKSGDVKTVVAQTGKPAVGVTNALYKRFLSVVVTDANPGRMLFTAVIAGPGVNARNNVGLWSVSDSDTTLVLRKGLPISAEKGSPTILQIEALQASRANQGQGRSTDANGFAAVRMKLSDRRVVVGKVSLP